MRVQETGSSHPHSETSKRHSPQIKPVTFNPRTRIFLLLLLALVPASSLHARAWKFIGIAAPYEAEFVGMQNGWVVLREANGSSAEFPFSRFTPADQQYLRALAAGDQAPVISEPGKPIASSKGYDVRKVETLTNEVVTLSGNTVIHVTGQGDPISGSTFIFTSPDSFLFLDQVRPSFVIENFLSRMRIDGKKAKAGSNVRVVQYGSGAVVIPHKPDFAAMTLYDGKALGGASIPLECFVKYDASKLRKLKNPAASFVLKRGYMATLAENENGTGISRNYVAQDHDVVVDTLPPGLDGGLRFVRVFPWCWTSKKGVAGGIWQDLNVGWFYDWNIGANSSPDLEYVPIRQNRHWPGLDQDWEVKGSTHLLGFNEPDRPDQANMKVDEAIAAWPLLLASGLRVGSPAPSDGGLGWLYEFIDKADAAKLRVDFVAVHYYRAVNSPGDAKGAADQFYRFLKGVHDRVKRPLWVTEWNNGANWTTAPDPNIAQQKDAIREMIKMLDDTPFVERYAIYNWVEEVRHIKNKDNSLTPAGEVYRDKVSPLAFSQPKPEK
jgi:hypothetical protein